MSMQLSTYSSLLPEEGGEGSGGLRSWRNPSTQDTSCAVDEGNEEDEDEQGGRLRNHMGVEIMPQIPEEDETEEEEEVIEAGREPAVIRQLVSTSSLDDSHLSLCS